MTANRHPTTPDKDGFSSRSPSSGLALNPPVSVGHTGAGHSDHGLSKSYARSPAYFTAAAIDPSPASTYGETAVGDSTPATPADIHGNGELTQNMSSLQINGAYSDKEAVTDHIVGDLDSTGKISPTDLGINKTGAYAKPLTPSRHCPAVSSPGGVRRSPGSNLRRRGSVHDSNWRTPRSVSFALPSTVNDPFYDQGHEHVQACGDVTGDGVGAIPTSTAGDSPVPDTPSSSSFRPRKDREVVEVSGENAQALFPPNCCVFVANLVQGLTDEQLEFSVSRAFEQFGKVYVKIKRDPRSMPYAFCQYENSEDAEKAIQQGRGLMIDGRQCRTERAKVNRSLYLTRITGGSVSEHEAREVLRGRGDLEKLWVPTPTEREMFRLGEGIWVMFAFFQDCRDAQALFKDSANYRLEAPHYPDEVQTRSASRSGPSPMVKATPARRQMSPVPYKLRQGEKTTVSVSGLPQDANGLQLQGLLSTHGTIRSCEIVSRPSLGGSKGFTVFAYIEFSSAEEARRASTADHSLNGVRLRVEIRDSPDAVPARFTGGVSAGSPHPRRTAGTSSVTREIAMARAIAAGIDAATVMQIFGVNQASQVSNSQQSVPTAVVSPPVQYPNYYASLYPQYGMSPAAAAENHMGHYQFSGMAPHYYSGMSAPGSYGYQASNVSANGHGGATATETH